MTAPTFTEQLPEASPTVEAPVTMVSSGNPPSGARDGVASDLLPSFASENTTPSQASSSADNQLNAAPSSGGSGSCKFPWGSNNSDNVVPITPDQMNAGWAMSPNQSCQPGQWCPYACAPGYYSAQWDSSAALYNGPGSMNGGLFCDSNGVLQKPFKDKPYCVPGMMNAQIRNTLGSSVSACQTVYPGNEAMIIPTVAGPGSTAPLNVVPNTYWLGTSSQFYVNLAGSDNGHCIWGTPDKPVGNWGPYIFGGGQGKDGNTYISVQYNPLYIESGFSPKDVYNVEIKCLQGNCNFPQGGSCKCEGGVCSGDNGCTVTLPSGAKA
ncbi:hypothetical protein BB560_002883, partial [Smittium megazygosporum]